MPRSFEGDQSADGLRFAIVASRFNDEIVSGLLAGALEIPQTVRALADRFDAVIAIGCILRGETPHFEFIASQVTTELSRVACDRGVPVAFGVITCETLQQAIDRSSPGAGNKGWEAALAAIEMANLWRALRTE